MTPPRTRPPLLVATPTHLVLSRPLMLSLLTGAVCLSLALAAVGLRDAYVTLGGPGTPAGRAVTVALVVAATGVLAAVGLATALRRRTARILEGTHR